MRDFNRRYPERNDHTFRKNVRICRRKIRLHQDRGAGQFFFKYRFPHAGERVAAEGLSYFVLDLSECVLMDSTFLGVLAGFGLKMNAAQKDGTGPAIELLNPNPRISDLLESLGVLHLFKLAQGASAPPEASEPVHHDPVNPTREEVTRACLEAHRTLMEINPENVSKFKEVAQFLADDLKKVKPAAE